MNLIKDGLLFSNYAKAPSPFQDYHQLLVNENEIIFRTWKITPRKIRALPTEVKFAHTEFNSKHFVKNDIKRVFGPEVLLYVTNLAAGHIDFLPRLPEKILSKIILYLNLEDYERLAKVSKQFSSLCKDEKLWEKVFLKHHKVNVDFELKELAEKLGWKHLAFTNIIQLRALLTRLRKSKRGGGDIMQNADDVIVPDDDILPEKFSVTSLRNAISREVLEQSVTKDGGSLEFSHRGLRFPAQTFDFDSLRYSRTGNGAADTTAAGTTTTADAAIVGGGFDVGGDEDGNDDEDVDEEGGSGGGDGFNLNVKKLVNRSSTHNNNNNNKNNNNNNNSRNNYNLTNNFVTKKKISHNNEDGDGSNRHYNIYNEHNMNNNNDKKKNTKPNAPPEKDPKKNNPPKDKPFDSSKLSDAGKASSYYPPSNLKGTVDSIWLRKKQTLTSASIQSGLNDDGDDENLTEEEKLAKKVLRETTLKNKSSGAAPPSLKSSDEEEKLLVRSAKDKLEKKPSKSKKKNVVLTTPKRKSEDSFNSK